MSFSEVLKYTKHLTLLYVEDEEISRELYTSIFEDLFLDIDTAIDGVDASEKYLLKSYDIVISDICMPNMDGFEFSKNILNKKPNQMIVIMSAYNDNDKLSKIKELGISNVLVKPIQNEELLIILEEVSKKVLELKNK